MSSYASNINSTFPYLIVNPIKFNPNLSVLMIFNCSVTETLLSNQITSLTLFLTYHLRSQIHSLIKITALTYQSLFLLDLLSMFPIILLAGMFLLYDLPLHP